MNDRNMCQSCNGDLSPVHDTHQQCEYCTTLHFVEELQDTIDRFIPHGTETETCCPACKFEILRVGSMQGEDVLYCRSCRGYLIDCQAMSDIVQMRRSSWDGGDLTPTPLNERELERNLSCPGCECSMEVHPYHGPGNVVIDSCVECRLVWLDYGEISRIERSPGLRRR